MAVVAVAEAIMRHQSLERATVKKREMNARDITRFCHFLLLLLHYYYYYYYHLFERIHYFSFNLSQAITVPKVQ